MGAARRSAVSGRFGVTVARGPGKHAEQARSMIICRVSERSLAIDIECVAEVIRAAETVPVGAPDPTSLGYLNVRGSHVPAIDTASALGLPARQMQPADRFVIIESSAGRLAILVEEVASIAEVVPVERGARAKDEEGSFTVAGRLLGEENRVVAIVDCERLGRFARAH